MRANSGILTADRYIICSGVSKYSEENFLELPRVNEETRRMANLMKEFGYKQVIPELEDNPTSGLFRASLSKWFSERSPSENSLIIVYHSGHGIYYGSTHYLLFADSQSRNLAGTAVPVRELASWILSPARFEQLLLILDTCYGGAGVDQFSEIASTLAYTFRTEYVSSGIFVLAAARSRDVARPGAFVDAFSETIRNPTEQWGGPTQQFIHPDQLVGAINTYFTKKGHHHHQSATMNMSQVRREFCLLENPKYRPDLPLGLDKLTQRTYDELAEHWVVSAKGAETASKAYYFTGRERVLRDVVAWLNSGQIEDAVRVITGSPGTGKSAVLARLVALSDSDFRKRAEALGLLGGTLEDTLPETGIIKVAVYARNKTLEQIVQNIADQLGCGATDIETLLKTLEQREDRLVIVLDALDESREPGIVVNSLLSRLVASTRVRLLIGSRRLSGSAPHPVVPGFSSSATEIDLDDAKYARKEDIARYVESRLYAKAEPSRRTPYRNAPEALVREIADAVAVKAGNNFLIARIVASYLMDARDIVDVRARDWKAEFPTGIRDAFDKLFDRFEESPDKGPLDKRRASELMRPLAFAEGQGLPRERIWEVLATALSPDTTYSDADVRILLEHAGAYVVETRARDRSVYRVYHKALADYLREGVDELQVQKRITTALIELTSELPGPRKRNWNEAHPYIRTHLAAHAAAAGMLDELLIDPEFLVMTDKSRLLPLLNRATKKEAKETAHVYGLAAHHIDSAKPGESLAYLEMVARQEGAGKLAETFASVPFVRFWKVDWANWQPSASHRLIGRHDHWVTAICIVKDSENVLIASGSRDASVRIFDVSGDEIFRFKEERTVSVNAVALGHLKSRVILASGRDDGIISVSYLDRVNERLVLADRLLLAGHDGAVNSLTICETPKGGLIVSGGIDGTVRLWDLDSCKSSKREFNGSGPDVRLFGLDVGSYKKKNGLMSITISGGSDRAVLVWDLEHGEPHRILCGHHAPVNAVAVGIINELPVIVSGGNDGTVHLWDLQTGELRGHPLAGHYGRVSALTTGMLANAPIIICGVGRDLVLWHLSGDKLTSRVVGTHDGPISSIASGNLNGRFIVVSASLDRTIRIWDLSDNETRCKMLVGHQSAVNGVAFAETAERSFVVSGGNDGTVRLWDLSDIDSHGWSGVSYLGSINSVAIGTLQRKPIIATAGNDGTIHLWDLSTGRPRGQPLVGHHGRASAVAIGEFERKCVIVSGGVDRGVVIWSVNHGRARKKVFSGHDGPISSVTLGRINKRPVVLSASLDGTIRIWDVTDNGTRCETLIGHKGSVNAVAFAEKGERSLVASGGSDGTVHLWDLY